MPSDPTKPARATLAGALAASLLLSACSGQLIDPTANTPIRPSDLSDLEEASGVPDAVPPILRWSLPGATAAHAARDIRISQLSRVERLANAPTLIDIRLDATDKDGAFASIAGDLRITIRCAGAEPATLAFDATLKTEPEVKRRRDDVLGQYVLRLEPIWTREPARGTPLEISANLLTTEGKLIESRTSLVW